MECLYQFRSCLEIFCCCNNELMLQTEQFLDSTRICFVDCSIDALFSRFLIMFNSVLIVVPKKSFWEVACLCYEEYTYIYFLNIARPLCLLSLFQKWLFVLYILLKYIVRPLSLPRQSYSVFFRRGFSCCILLRYIVRPLSLPNIAQSVPEVGCRVVCTLYAYGNFCEDLC